MEIGIHSNIIIQKRVDLIWILILSTCVSWQETVNSFHHSVQLISNAIWLILRTVYKNMYSSWFTYAVMIRHALAPHRIHTELFIYADGRYVRHLLLIYVTLTFLICVHSTIEVNGNRSIYSPSCVTCRTKGEESKSSGTLAEQERWSFEEVWTKWWF